MRWLPLLFTLVACAGGGDDDLTSDPTDATDPSDTGTDTDTDGTDTSDTATDTGTPSAGPTWTLLTTDGLDGRWGAFPAGAHHVGGIAGLDAGGGTLDIVSYRVDGDALVADVRGTATVGRFCGCAFEDTIRDELVIVGGRNEANFQDESTAERIDSDGVSTSLEHGGAAGAPVGCAAFYDAGTDRGYVFGGAGMGSLDDQTWRYDPVAGTFTALDLPGPSPRYDAGITQTADGTVYLVGGLTGDGMASDVWRFDPTTETWTELPYTSEDAPEGRRFPFLVNDEAALYYGYGTNSPSGQRMLKQIWRFDLATSAWEQLSFDGDTPDKRGFGVTLPGPPGSLGVLAFGFDGDRTVFDDAWVLWP